MVLLRMEYFSLYVTVRYLFDNLIQINIGTMQKSQSIYSVLMHIVFYLFVSLSTICFIHSL